MQQPSVLTDGGSFRQQHDMIFLPVMSSFLSLIESRPENQPPPGVSAENRTGDTTIKAPALETEIGAPDQSTLHVNVVSALSVSDDDHNFVFTKHQAARCSRGWFPSLSAMASRMLIAATL